MPAWQKANLLRVDPADKTLTLFPSTSGMSGARGTIDGAKVDESGVIDSNYKSWKTLDVSNGADLNVLFMNTDNLPKGQTFDNIKTKHDELSRTSTSFKEKVARLPRFLEPIECYIRMPTGCDKPVLEAGTQKTSDPFQYRHWRKGDENNPDTRVGPTGWDPEKPEQTCRERARWSNSHCNRTDARWRVKTFQKWQNA